MGNEIDNWKGFGNRENAVRVGRLCHPEMTTSAHTTKIVTIVATDPRAKTLALVYAATFRYAPWNEDIDAGEQAHLWQRHSETKGARYLAAFFGNTLVGGAEFMPLDLFPERRNLFPTVTYGSLFLNDIFVSPSAQNKKVGSKLLNEVEAMAVTHGFSHLSLRTHATYDKLLNFYQARGYAALCDVPSTAGGSMRRVFIKSLGV